MILEPDLVQHPKYIALRAAVGDLALEMLVRLWGHCQRNKKGHIWRGADERYVEVVCTGEHRRGRVFRSLLQIGWIEQVKGAVIIHDWDRYNRKFTGRWNRIPVQDQPHSDQKQNCPDQPPDQPPDQGKKSPDHFLSCHVLSCHVPSSLPGPKERERERAPGVAEGKAAPAPAEILACRTQAGLLTRHVKELEAQMGDLTAEQREDLKKSRRALRDLQARQRAGNFTLTAP